MVKHIVMWNFKEEVEETDKVRLGQEMKQQLEALKDKIAGLLNVQFMSATMQSSTHDLALICDLTSEEALVEYQKHPEHVKVADDYVRPYVHQRSCLDYIV